MAFSCVLETPDFKISPTAATKVPPPGDRPCNNYRKNPSIMFPRNFITEEGCF